MTFRIQAVAPAGAGRNLGEGAVRYEVESLTKRDFRIHKAAGGVVEAVVSGDRANALRGRYLHFKGLSDELADAFLDGVCLSALHKDAIRADMGCGCQAQGSEVVTVKRYGGA